MRWYACLPALAVTLFVATSTAARDKVPLVGVVISGDPQSPSPAHVRQRDAFLRGMADLGYVEGRTVGYDLRFWGNDTASIATIMAEFARTPVDIIVTQATVGAHEIGRAHV